MNAFSNIDMREVTRLTRAGKLVEAMALLQGRAELRAGAERPPSAAPAGAKPIAPPSPTIDRTASSAKGNRTTLLTPGRTGALRPAALGRSMQALGERLAKAHRLPGVRQGALPPSPMPLPEGARFEERSFANRAGGRTYKIYVPSGYVGQALPVVVMLHGCTQDPDDFAAGTRMNQHAEEQTFLVVYPRQPPSANPQKCWNWFKTEDQQRGGGEPSLIAGVVSQVIEEFSADPTRVYVAGLSAGGAAAAILGATYPDLFAAVGVHSGLACGAARDMPSAFAAMAGKGMIPPRGGQPGPPTIVFHGDADKTVHSVNGDQVIVRAGGRERLTSAVTRGETPAGMAYTRTVQSDAAGRERLEQWVLHGAGHAWSGGSADGSYTDPRGPDASREMIRFFLRHAKERRF